MKRQQAAAAPSPLHARPSPPAAGRLRLLWTALKSIFAPSEQPTSSDLNAILDFTLGAQRLRHVNELIHFILAAVTSPALDLSPGGIIFFVNERTGVLQGMHGVTREFLSSRPLPAEQPEEYLPPRKSPFCSTALWLRIPLTAGHPAVRAFSTRSTQLGAPGDDVDEIATLFASEFGSGSYLAVPLTGSEKTFGVLIVSLAGDTAGRSPSCRKGLIETVARQAELAIDNAMILRRLENTRQELLESEARAQQDEKLVMLGEVVASIAHDIKTPLVSIGGFAKRLEQIADNEESLHHASVITRQVRKLEEILGGILTFSRKELVCYVPCDLKGLVDEVLQAEEVPLQQAGIMVKTIVAGRLPPIQGDAVRLTQVLTNLIVNARQAMSPGGELKLRLGRGLLRGAPAVTIEVEDTGPGIPPETAACLFKPFFTTKPTGTGLGLAISARIIEQHHGDIRAANATHGGAIFRITLPAVAGDQGET